MEDKGSKRRAFAIFGLLFAGLAITLAMILRQVPDSTEQDKIVSALTQAPAPGEHDHREIDRGPYEASDRGIFDDEEEAAEGMRPDEPMNPYELPEEAAPVP